MSAEQSPDPVASETPELPVLRREALLSSERSRGLGAVAVVCTMAGVASGLALATTLMAMQVANGMSARACPYHSQAPASEMRDVHFAVAPAMPDHGFLGIRYVYENGGAHIDHVLASTPAETAGLTAGDYIVALDGAPVTSGDDLQRRIFMDHPGEQALLTVRHADGAIDTIAPTLTSYPTIRYSRY